VAPASIFSARFVKGEKTLAELTQQFDFHPKSIKVNYVTAYELSFSVAPIFDLGEALEQHIGMRPRVGAQRR